MQPDEVDDGGGGRELRGDSGAGGGVGVDVDDDVGVWAAVARAASAEAARICVGYTGAGE